MSEEVQHISELERIYKDLAAVEVNSQESIDAYLAWHSAALLYLSDYYTDDNADFVRFKNLDNSCNGYGLNANYRSISGICNMLLKKVETNINPMSVTKAPKIFISHSSKDRPFVKALVDLLEDIGIPADCLFCSTIPEYGVRLSHRIFDELKNQFTDHELFVIIVHSPRYYQSVASLNEMGAAWVLGNRFCSFLTTDMPYNQMTGVINSDYLSLKVDEADAQARLNELKNSLVDLFDLSSMDENKWERKRNNFLAAVNAISYPNAEPETDTGTSIDEEYKRLQIEKMKQEEENRRKALIKGNIVPGSKSWSMNLRIYNAGKAEAKNVRVEWLNQTESVNINGDFTNLGKMTPQNYREFRMISFGDGLDFMRLRYTWEDDFSDNNIIEEELQLL